eukprot:11866374-Alexandrium_andersonii.AAC.1
MPSKRRHLVSQPVFRSFRMCLLRIRPAFQILSNNLLIVAGAISFNSHGSEQCCCRGAVHSVRLVCDRRAVCNHQCTRLRGLRSSSSCSV